MKLLNYTYECDDTQRQRFDDTDSRSRLKTMHRRVDSFEILELQGAHLLIKPPKPQHLTAHHTSSSIGFNSIPRRAPTNRFHTNPATVRLSY